MSESPPSPVAQVQVMQALVARELVEGFGVSERQAALLLGIVPSSVSQYLSGKRLGPALSAHLADDEALFLARQTAQKLMAGAAGTRTVLEAAIALGERASPGPSRPAAAEGSSLTAELHRRVPGWLRDRTTGEQNAVAECMRLAQRARDELTRALFRQIASDSLRHAEIVASLAAYLDRGVTTSGPTGITHADIDHLLRREREAEATSDFDLGPRLGGMMRILWDSMEADERKHELLLQKLLKAGPPDAPHPGPGRSRKSARVDTEG